MKSVLALSLLASTLLTACDKDSPVAPTPTPTTFTLSGSVTDPSGTAINGAVVTITDGANAGRSTTTANGGVFNLTGLTPSDLTLNVTAINFQPSGVRVNLTSNQNVMVRLAHSVAPTTTPRL
jgi:protocatechuate 3,4-dioxygenase beta subunit